MGAPLLTIVVAGSKMGGPPPGLAAVLAPHLRSGEAELLFVTAAATPPDLGELPNARVLVLDSGATVPRLRSAGLEAARAPFVALTEDFCVPSEDWVRRLLSARQSSQAPVVGGPVSRRSGSGSDWARTFVEYGRFMARSPEGEVDDLPGTNVAYERAVLVKTLGEIPEDFQEVFVHAQMRAAGVRFWNDPAAIVFDESHAGLGPTMRSMYHHGRLYGGARVEGAGWATRCVRAISAPLVPGVHLLRIARNAKQAGLLGRLVRSLFPLLALECSWAWGECVGSLRGEGASRAEWT